jgi:hypothetical protein
MRLSSLMSSGEALPGPRIYDAWVRNPSFQKPVHALPVEAMALTAAI